MTNVAIQRDHSKDPASRHEVASPIRLWRDMLRWDPFAQMLPALTAEEDRALFSPDFDVKETKDAFIFRADIPGVEQKHVQVQLTDNRLTISGERSDKKEEKSDTSYRCERSFGSFSRAFTLPSGIDREKVKADLKSGVLTVNVPRTPGAKPKQINVNGS